MPEKKERLKVYQLSLRHPCLAQFRNRPFGYRLAAQSSLVLLSFYMLAALVAIVFVAFTNTSYGEVIAIALFVVCCMLLLGIALPILNNLAFRSMLSQMNEEHETKRRPEEAVSYVGVVYFGGMADLDQIDSDWDRGWLSIETGCLVFRGINSQFRLPLIMIKAVRIALPSAGTVGGLPRVAVMWCQPDGTNEHFVIDIRDAISKKDGIRRVDLLEGRINDAIRLHGTEREFDERELPFRSTVAEQAEGYVAKVLKGEDIAIAIVLSATFLIPAAALYYLALRAMGHPDFRYLHFLVLVAPFNVAFCLALFWRQAKRLREGVDGE